MATTRRVSVQDAEGVYRRLQRIVDLLDELPTKDAIEETTGPKNSMYAMGFNSKLMMRTFDLITVTEALRTRTQDNLETIRRTLEQLLKTDAEAEAEAKKLSVSVEGHRGVAGLHSHRAAPGQPVNRTGR